MKNLFYILTIVFSGLCFISAQYIFYTGGRAGTTLAVLFLVFAYIFSYYYTALENKKAMIAKMA